MLPALNCLPATWGCWTICLVPPETPHQRPGRDDHRHFRTTAFKDVRTAMWPSGLRSEPLRTLTAASGVEAAMPDARISKRNGAPTGLEPVTSAFREFSRALG